MEYPIMNCTDVEEIAGAYVLDAVTPEEQREIEAHLAQCPRCSQMIQELRAVVDLLPLAVPQIEPSPELKDRILSAVQSRANVATQSTQRVAIATPLPLSPQPVPIQQARQRRVAARRWTTQLIAAAAILFFLLSGTMLAWNVSLQHQIASISSSAPVTYTIKSTASNPGISGQVIYYPQQHMTIMEVHGLAQTTGTQVYQGWLLQGTKPTSIGLLNVHDGVATLDYPGSISGFDTAAVSLEPGPQASKDVPHGQVLATGSLTKAA